MDRLFLDANILFSAAWRPDAGLRRFWTLPEVSLFTSAYAIEEALRNLPQEEQLDRLDQLLIEVQVVSEWDHIALPEDIVLPEKDIPILQAAIVGQATHLITGDIGDFGIYFGRNIDGVEILLPAIYLRRVNS